MEEKWKSIEGLEAIIEKAVQQTCLALKDQEGQELEVSILLASDEKVQELNKKYRGKDKPTNVLSFPGICNNEGSGSILLGDIILSYETILAESISGDKPHMDHITHLVVHGVLHLFGYDHEDEVSASEMENIEISILKEFGIKNPYAV